MDDGSRLIGAKKRGIAGNWRLDQVLALSGVWLWSANAAGRVDRLSDNVEALAGIRTGAWLDRQWRELCVGVADPKLIEAGNAPFTGAIFIYVDAAGIKRVAELSGEPLVAKNGRPRGWRGTGRDVTAAWLAERNARQAEELLMGAMESISEGFALYDADDRLLLFNENYNFFRQREISPVVRGARFEDIVRDAVTRGYYPAARGREEAWMRERSRYHRDPKGIFEIELYDGRWLQIIERRTQSGGTVTINTDITAVKRRDEKQLQGQKLQALGQLTGGVAHDFSNVLLILECNLDLAVQALQSAEDPKQFLDSCEAAIRMANGLSQRLLAVARQQPLQPKIVNINDLASRMHEFLRRTLAQAIAIETVLNPGLWHVLVDESQLETAILNLALNARDAMPEGGNLRLETSNLYLQQSWVDQQHDLRSGSYVVITVSDTGAGMTRDILTRAMEPFFTTKTGGKGSGLGLSMTYGFIKQSGGDVEIASAPGRGTTVKLFLPRVDIGDSFGLNGN